MHMMWWTLIVEVFFFSSRRRHTRLQGDWSSDVCSSDLLTEPIISKLKGIVEDLGGKQGYTIILEKNENNVLFSKPKDDLTERSEERRVGKECRSRWAACQ